MHLVSDSIWLQNNRSTYVLSTLRVRLYLSVKTMERGPKVIEEIPRNYFMWGLVSKTANFQISHERVQLELWTPTQYDTMLCTALFFEAPDMRVWASFDEHSRSYRQTRNSLHPFEDQLCADNERGVRKSLH